jgi:hypothetical protein
LSDPPEECEENIAEAGRADGGGAAEEELGEEAKSFPERGTKDLRESCLRKI